jgi:hypothetical protein
MRVILTPILCCISIMNISDVAIPCKETWENTKLWNPKAAESSFLLCSNLFRVTSLEISTKIAHSTSTPPFASRHKVYIRFVYVCASVIKHMWDFEMYKKAVTRVSDLYIHIYLYTVYTIYWCTKLFQAITHMTCSAGVRFESRQRNLLSWLFHSFSHPYHQIIRRCIVSVTSSLNYK